MLKIVKFGGITVGVGLVAGLGVAAWMYTHRPDDTVSARPGSVAFDGGSSPSPSPVASNGAAAQNLAVTKPDSGSVQGAEQQRAADPTPTPTPALPGPSGFGVYEQYKNNTAALYIDIVAGTGQDVAKGSQVTVNYRGWLTTGAEFDESYAKGAPFTFTEGSQGVIVGWQEGIFGMKVGGKRRIIVPPALGYGATPHDPIPANAVLIFDVELVGIK